MTKDLTERQKEYLDELPQPTRQAWADAVGVEKTTLDGVKRRLEEKGSVTLGSNGVWRRTDGVNGDGGGDDSDTGDEQDIHEWTETPISDAEPDPSELTSREKYLARKLQTGATVEELADDLEERVGIITEHLRDLREHGWRVYHDRDAEHIAIDGDHALRSSEHKGTRTRKANRWWELRHNEVVREFRSLKAPSATQNPDPANEDWVLHLTDLHAGDLVRQADGTVVYDTETIPQILEYITEKSLSLSEYHNAEYDTAHLLWGGDFVTNEGIYEGQFEDLDAWLDEQHDSLVDPLIKQLKAHAGNFETVQVVCQVGNHGDHRASGTSKQANADLILYKSIRNVVAQICEHSGESVLNNVNFLIGEARPYRNFELRNGKVRGHLRHGQHRRPQAETSARKKEWLITLRRHKFDVAWAGHHHVSGTVPWNGPPVHFSGSPKIPDDFVESIGEYINKHPREIAHCHAVADHGVSFTAPVKSHGFEYTATRSCD